MPIRACPQCSSDRLRFPTSGTDFDCPDCGWSGTPNEFASWGKWQEFRAAAASTRPALVQ